MEEESINRLVSPQETDEEINFEQTLRPKSLNDYIGQEQIKSNIDICMQAAKQRSEPLEHVLISGPPGLGKTTLANIIANEMNANFKITSGPAIERSGDLAALLTNLEQGDILFIDEIHRLNRAVEEILYPAMEDYFLDLIIGKGPTARSLKLELPKFTLIGATTKLSLLSSPLRDRFGHQLKLDFYQDNEVEKIIERSAKILSLNPEPQAVEKISKCSRKTPRIANRLLKRVRDFSQVKGEGIINLNIANQSLELLGIDELGLDPIDKKILETIIHKFEGGPVGLNTLAAATGEEMSTLEDIYEPFLIQLGFLNRTPRGRTATTRAFEHLKTKPNNSLI